MSRYEFEVRYTAPQIRHTTWSYVRVTLVRGMGVSGWMGVGVLPVIWG